MTQSTRTDSLYFSLDELREIGFSSVGNNCRISRKCSFYSISGEIGNHVRIDDYCIIKGNVTFASYIHIGAYSLVSGIGARVRFEDCTTLSSAVHVYTASDDYSADALSSSSVPKMYTVTKFGPVTFHCGALVGAHTLILPNTTVGCGASVGAQCIVYGCIPEGAVVANRSAIGRVVGQRNSTLIRAMVEKLISNSLGRSDSSHSGNV